jgi:hypothetical protein
MLLIISLLLTGAVTAASLPPQLGNVSKSEAHPPTYVNLWTRLYASNITGYHFTINYTKVPRILQGVTPQLKRPTDLEQDIIRKSEKVLLDPRTCPNDIAHCYQVRERNETANITGGRNYTAISSYQLPATRIKSFVCIGDDLDCVKSATNCYCPEAEVPPPPLLWQNGKCSDTTHLCMNSYGSFLLCEGNLSDCRAKYDVCGCGRRAACIAANNVCVNERNELTLCKGGISDCLGKYKSCYCGTDMMQFQTGCKSLIHSCTKNGKTFTCYGKFDTCALQADSCGC